MTGPSQTIQRAELLAVRTAIAWEHGPLTVCADSLWVLGGFAATQRTGNPEPRWEHWDVWQTMNEDLQGRAPGCEVRL